MTTLLAEPRGLAELRGVDWDSTDYTSLLALEAASAYVRGYCGQTFDLVLDDEVILDGTGRRTLLLPQLPVHDVTSVASLDSEGTPTVLEDYYLGNAGVLWSSVDGCFPAGHGNIAITYSHGYELDRSNPSDYPYLPEDLELAILSIAARSISQVGASGVVTAETIGSYSVQYADPGSDGGSSPVGPLEAAVLDNYRLTARASR